MIPLRTRGSEHLDIRPGTPEDADAVAAVCLATARGGDPLPADHPDPDLFAAVFARPYLALEPQTARLLVLDRAVAGYVVGAVDSASFYRRWQQEWTPLHTPRPDFGLDQESAHVAHLLRNPMAALPEGVQGYPSHLHINLLPRARGGGNAARLLAGFVDGLVAAGSPGVHLDVAVSNARAIRFYERSGFEPLAATGSSVTMVRRLT